MMTKREKKRKVREWAMKIRGEKIVRMKRLLAKPDISKAHKRLLFRSIRRETSGRIAWHKETQGWARARIAHKKFLKNYKSGRHLM